MELLQLPPEITTEILTKLPLLSFLNCRCVCKTLCSNVDEIRFSKLHLLNFTNKPTTTTCTSFIVCVRRKSNDYYFVSDIDGSLVVKRYWRIGFPIRNMWLWSISHGVIFLQRSNSRYLASLATGKYAQVLELDPSKTGCYSFGMGFSVSTKELKVVQVFSPYRGTTQQPESHFEVFAVGACRRKTMGIVSYKDLYGRSVCVSGSLHWVANANRNGIYDLNAPAMYILSFNLDSEEFGEIISPLIDVALPGGSWDDFYKLGVLGGCLSFTDCKSSKGYIDIWVLKDYDVNKVWNKQYVVGLSFPFELSLRGVRAICLRENGEILLQLYYGSLISYNPESGKSKKVQIVGLGENLPSLSIFLFRGARD